jgi:hypothetical protein
LHACALAGCWRWTECVLALKRADEEKENAEAWRAEAWRFYERVCKRVEKLEAECARLKSRTDERMYVRRPTRLSPRQFVGARGTAYR